MIYHWARLPAYFVRFNGLKDLRPRQPSKDIAAMKLYILFAIKIRTHGTGAWVSLTYDELTEMAGLSRTLVSTGIQRLLSLKLILVKGDKKKTYSLKEHPTCESWTKIPVGVLLDLDGNITAFKSFRNRYDYELNALILYLYLLYIRHNYKSCSIVTNATIHERTGMTFGQINTAVGFMKSCGLLIERTMQITAENLRFDDDNLRAYSYELLGGKVLRKGVKNAFEDDDDPF